MKRPHSFVIGCLRLLICTQAFANFENAILQVDTHYHLFSNPLFGDQPLGMDQIDDLTHRAKDYPDFLKQLKLRAPDLFKTPVLLHHSASLQYASFENPRVILFGRGALFAFSEHPENKDQTVEVILFDRENSRFSPVEINFGANQPPHLNRSPRECHACHGKNEDFRPLWQPYDFWPNAYGAASEFLETQSEQKAFARFLEKKPKPGIYQEIEINLNSNPNPNLNPNPHPKRIIGADEFTQYVNSLNYLRITSILRDEFGTQNPFRYALLAALNGCMDSSQPYRVTVTLRDLVPPSLFSQMTLSLDEIYWDTVQSRQDFLKTLDSEYRSYFQEEPAHITRNRKLDLENSPIASARFILENLGIDWARFTLSRGEKHSSLAVPTYFAFDITNALIDFNATLFQEEKPTLRAYSGTAIRYFEFDCLKLAERSLDALSSSTIDLAPLTHPKLRPHGAGLAPMARCLNCHEVEMKGPYIPFGDSLALHHWLNENRNYSSIISKIDSGAMPKESKLSITDQEDLKKAFTRLLK